MGYSPEEILDILQADYPEHLIEEYQEFFIKLNPDAVFDLMSDEAILHAAMHTPLFIEQMERTGQDYIDDQREARDQMSDDRI